ncbi:hypothetical protein DXG01_003857 [Tephrocybe rancida]|nr:hypothetical protein DXG01_003857 [Tephrocybe rancida]
MANKRYTHDRHDIHAMQKQGMPKAQKKKKNFDESTPIGADFAHLEYAIERKILETPLLELSYFFDVAGEVPALSDYHENIGVESIDIGNGDVAPDWGFDIIINGGVLRYGPWADRQRAELQRAFFPPTYHDGECTTPLKPGDKRLWTAMQIFVELRDNTVLHIPFREPSKACSYFLLHSFTTLTRRIGLAILMVYIEIHCEMPTPLKWNSERRWMIALALRQPVLYLIRDHINMFIDLGKDWTTGPPTDYQRFIPTVYGFEIALHHYELNQYVNDHNIIDKPLLRDENALLTLRGAHFNVTADILSNEFRPECTKIPFTIDVPDVSLSLSLPRWNINALHAPKEGNSLANVRFLHVDGSYQYFADVREDHVDQLKLKFDLCDVAFKNLGWSIRYFMVLKDNYLGSFTHFTTLFEYLDRRKRNQPLGDPLLSKYRPGKNYPEMVTYRKETLHGLKNILHVDGRYRLYPVVPKSMLIVLILGLDITANRLFGPQPRTATYICIWEINLGATKALLSAAEGRLLAAAGNAFRLNFADALNAPADEYILPLDPDGMSSSLKLSCRVVSLGTTVTFVKFSLRAFNMIWRAGHAALVIDLPQGIKADSNDLGGRHHRKATSLQIAEICTKLLLTSSLHGGRWLEAMKFTADAYLDIYSAPYGYREKAQSQISYIEEQDRLTGRARRMVASLKSQNATESSSDCDSSQFLPHKNGMYLPNPKLPDCRIKGSQAFGQARVETARKQRRSVAQLSDSDAEEGISEADRDARLAKTRSSTPVPRFTYEDNRNMSSGDESDDEDLTDSGSDSDWSDFADGSADLATSTLQHYSHVTRHYMTRLLESPKLWDGCPFVLVRDCPQLSTLIDEMADNIGDQKLEPELLNIPVFSSDDQDNIYLRFKGRKSVTIRVTPMILQAVIHFEDDIKKNPLGPELCLDAMMASHLGTMSSSQETASCIRFEAFVPAIKVQALQRIVMANGHPMISRDPPKIDNLSEFDVVAVIQAGFGGISTSGSINRRSLSLEAGFVSSSVTLDVSFDKKTIKPSSDNFVFNYDMNTAKLSMGQNTFAIAWGEGTFRIGHMGPEYMVATGLALAHSARELVDVGQKWNDPSSSLRRTIVSDVIRCSGDRAAVDPLSTIQPSYLVQKGIPHKLRSDTTFRFLYHLRNCLWHLEAHERDWSMQQVDLDTLILALEARLIALDPDSYNVAQLSSLQPLFPILQIDSPSLVPVDITVPSRSLALRFTKLSIVVLDPSTIFPSELVVADVDIRAHAVTSNILQLPSLDNTMSQTSLREKRSQNVLKCSALVHFGDVTLTVSPHLMGFAQHVLRVRRYFLSISSSIDKPMHSPSPGSINGYTQLYSADVLLSLGHLRVRAAAENLVFEFGLSGVRGASSLLFHSQASGGQSMNHSLLFDKIFIRARSPSNVAKRSEQDILASLELTFGRLSTLVRTESSLKTKLRLVFSLGDLQLLVPRSALRLYRFIQEWRADFLPGIEATVKALLSELRRTPNKPSSPRLQRSSSGRPSFQVQGGLSHVGIALQVMHGTWLSWEANSLTAYINSSNAPIPGYAFGLQIASVTLSISSKPNARNEEPGTRVKLMLPPLSATGRYDRAGIHTIVLIDFVELKVKPSHWDTLLVVQQKFGQDFHDLVTLVQETNVHRTTPEAPNTSRNPQVPLLYSAFVKMRGFRIGLEGPASTVYFECLDISGGINNSTGLTWNVGLSDLAFSLASPAASRPSHPGFDRNHHSAFVIIDFKIDARNELLDGTTSTMIQVLVTKMHAVTQPSSIGEVGDFIDHLQVEMLERKDQRALELAAFKEKTRRILQTFEVGVQDTFADSQPWLGNYIINVSTRNIGVAFPLTHDHDLQLPRTGSRDSTAVSAFLWSIESIEFGTHRGQTGQAEMKAFSFQFVSRFRQSVPDDFSGGNHVTRNRLIYPEMKAQLRSTHSAALRHVYVRADVSGFILDLDSSIPSYVFSLIDVYRQGKDRMEKISNNLPRTPSTLGESVTEKEIRAEQPRTTLPTSNLFASMTFRSGKVRVYSGAASRLYRARAFPHSHQEPTDEQIMEIGAEVFNLPVVSVWTEYRTTIVSQKPGPSGDPESSILMFKSTVHSSQNTLRPTLLPFLTELVNHVEGRLRRISLQMSHSSTTIVEDPVPHGQQTFVEPAASLRISFSLRIDQSKLELTCQPDVNVIAGLHWDSGGFVVNVSPGARKVTFTGTVGGLTIGLKHGFLSEDCVRLDARNLTFSVAFAKFEGEGGTSSNSVSIVLDTEFLGVVRFSRLQDILCFKAVWLDRIPVFNSPPTATSAKTIRSSPNAPLPSQAPKQHFTTIILIRIRRITLDVDLGQSISAMTLDLKDAVMRTKLTEALNEVSVLVDDLTIIAKGNVAGHAHVPNAEPLEVKIFDDWAPRSGAETKPLQLSFTVKSPDIVAVATVGTVPKLLAYVNKFKSNLDAQRLGASRESKAFRVTRTPKPDNPLSAVAEAMLISARSRFQEAENGLNYVIMQHMSLELDFLRLVVFPRTMDDLEIAQFIGRDVKARLNRLVESEPTTGKRDLLLSFSSMIISKFTGLGHPQTSELLDGRKWLASLLDGASEATIVGLPSMTMHMVSEEQIDDLTTTLVYDFHSEFVRQEDNREYKDIYITLNVSLYSWLTVLRKNLTREMEQVKASTDWRALLNTSSAQIGGYKKKPEPLNLAPNSPRSSTMPSPLTRPFSPFSPTTALKSSMGGPMGLSSPTSSTMLSPRGVSPGPQDFPSIQSQTVNPTTKHAGIMYQPRSRHIERLTMRQLGEATPDVMHPFFMKKAGFNLEDSLPQYVNEYATRPLEEIMEVLLKLYSRQLLSSNN